MTNPASSSLAAILVACAVLLPIPAGAADGEVLINQAAVNAGGITPGDGPGFPVTISQRGKYKLSGILAVPTGVDGIDVTVEDVTIDFNGFTIRSAPAGAAKIGISAFGARLTVMNGTVLGFGEEESSLTQHSPSLRTCGFSMVVKWESSSEMMPAF